MTTTPITWANCQVTLGELQPWADNPRLSTKAQARRLLESWQRFGQVQTIAIGPAGQVYDGHQRLSALLTLHGKSYQVDARRSDRELTDEERRELVVTLHAGAVGAWNWEELSNWEAGLLQEWGFDSDTLTNWQRDVTALGNLLQSEEADSADAEPQIDRAAELQEKWQVKPGDVWRIGEHKLACGDCTDRAVVERVMGGEKADACISDPPYGIDFDTDYTRFTAPSSTQFSGVNKKHAPIAGDDKPFDPTPLLGFDAVVLFGANFYADKLPVGTWLVWDKRFANGKAWLSDAELAWMKGGSGVYIFSLTSQGMIRPESVQHPTQKPVALMEWCIEKSKAGIIVFDPFLGSGTTLVACQNLGRRGRGIEISPEYCAVVLERMATAFPGIEIERIADDGRQ